jgi:hypothetical protein
MATVFDAADSGWRDAQGSEHERVLTDEATALLAHSTG